MRRLTEITAKIYFSAALFATATGWLEADQRSAHILFLPGALALGILLIRKIRLESYQSNPISPNRCLNCDKLRYSIIG